MILKSLYDYYNRSGDTTPTGFESKETSYALLIDKEGNFLGIEDLRDDNGRGKTLIVPRSGRSGTTPKPYLFWDNPEYILGYNPSNRTAANQKHAALKAKYRRIADEYPENSEMLAVCLFYGKYNPEMLETDPKWSDIQKKPAVNLTFHVKGNETFVAECADLKDYVARDIKNGDDSDSVCLITGARTKAVETTSPTPVAGGKSTGRLVSFQVSSGYDSYGKSKAFNAPMSPEAEGAYTTALKKLTGKDSRNKLLVGDGNNMRTFVFWAEAKSNDVADRTASFLSQLFGNKILDDQKDNPNAGIAKISELYKSVWSGLYKTGSADRFYMLGLAPNAARIAVVYWRVCSIQELAGNILRHLDDMSIIGDENIQYPYVGIYSILSQISLDGSKTSVSPNLPEALFKSITEGTPYPFPLFRACIARIRASQKINTARAAIIKAYLTRINYKNINFNRMLDKTNTNPGYLCGRLFALLELIQEKATPGLNSTIRDRYITSASSSPASVFPTLLNLSFHHEDKLTKGAKVVFEKEKGNIIDLLPGGCFPAHLDINEQGCFMVGYYQERQDYFRKKDNNDTNGTTVE